MTPGFGSRTLWVAPAPCANEWAGVGDGEPAGGGLPAPVLNCVTRRRSESMHTQQVKCTTIIAAVTGSLFVAAAPAAARDFRVKIPVARLRDAGRTGRKRHEWRRRARRSGTGTVAFSSTATNLLTTDANLAATEEAIPEIYVRRPQLGTTELASATATGEKANAGLHRTIAVVHRRPRRIPSAANNLDPAGSGNQQLRRLRQGPRHGNGDPRLRPRAAASRANGPTSDVALSGDGQAVAFVSTATNLDPRDTDSAPDVYVKNLVTGTRHARVHRARRE